MGRVKMNFFDVLDKYEYWKENCVKSVLLTLCSVTMVLSQIWGPPFCPGPPTAGGPFLRLC